MSEAARKRRYGTALGYLTALCGPVVSFPDKQPTALVSSDGYTLQDVNGLNLIPKEGK